MNTPTVKDWLIVIPARLQSQRLHEKPLQDLCGKPMIVRVFENIRLLEQKKFHIVVACDDRKVLEVLEKYKIPAMMTKVDHQSGSDRCFEVSIKNPHYKYILNVQGDEPFLNAEDLLRLCERFEHATEFDIGTLVFKSHDKLEFHEPSIVKAVRSLSSEALYFSRSPVPSHARLASDEVSFWHHLGTYAFRKETLERFCKLEPSPLENTEKLEQLRALDHGMKILLVDAEHKCRGIDTPEDLERARVLYAQKK